MHVLARMTMDINKEIFVTCKKYPRYAVSNMGNVVNLGNGNMLEGTEYYNKKQDRMVGRRFSLSDEDGEHKVFGHKLVADAFLPNPNNQKEVDHISRDVLDNTIKNLRWCTRRQNSLNRGMQTNNTSGFIGVSFDKANGRYQAYAKTDGKRKHLGLFDCPETAARIRDVYVYHTVSNEDRQFLELNFHDYDFDADDTSSITSDETSSIDSDATENSDPSHTDPLAFDMY